MNKPILLFDGVCNLCNDLVRFIIKRDHHARFLFASLQSESGQNYLNKFGLCQTNFDSFVYVEGDKYYTKSTAALHMFKTLGGFWRLLFIFILVPKPIRDFIYNYVAKNRYKWFGQQDSCMMPTPELKKRFLE
ncbi:thiol-disulfide oxidoreductase DCC family protein [Bacillus carboniphilus]|uniref:Thiol-disulfide oxidoreductase DCC family protein n=1 Tax=Bacillus carboniphilus TaxID=86663 RepID=A0ABY9JVP8_9BACI|nr:thiol-disulfide oxidoreductase DCC family protein [Bacillus carboniphilus]WLR42495.1 thiol-disulfide oxidoreductase DCC family protein [Bacillus carboniphilus]